MNPAGISFSKAKGVVTPSLKYLKYKFLDLQSFVDALKYFENIQMIDLENK